MSIRLKPPLGQPAGHKGAGHKGAGHTGAGHKGERHKGARTHPGHSVSIRLEPPLGQPPAKHEQQARQGTGYQSGSSLH